MVNSDSVDPLLLKFLSCFDRGASIMDLGCGTGKSAAILRDHGMVVDAVDASTEMVRFANENYQLGARQALFTDIDSSDAYDGVWANFSLLHASRDDFPVILCSLQKALKPKGLLHLGLKLGTGSSRDSLGRLYTYFGEDELRQFLEESGFTPEYVKHASGPGLAGNIEPWILIISRKTDTQV